MDSKQHLKQQILILHLSGPPVDVVHKALQLGEADGPEEHHGLGVGAGAQQLLGNITLL